METTLEEARRCPKCEQPGTFSHKRPLRQPRGAVEHTFKCLNQRCKWYNETCSVVTVRADGTIPQPSLDRPKQFPKLPLSTERIQESVDRQIAAELSTGGSEIRNSR